MSASANRRPMSNKPKNGQPYYALSGDMALSREQADFCRRRVYGLLGPMEIGHRLLPDLLANAYALGLKDAVQISSEVK